MGQFYCCFKNQCDSSSQDDNSSTSASDYCNNKPTPSAATPIIRIINERPSLSSSDSITSAADEYASTAATVIVKITKLLPNNSTQQQQQQRRPISSPTPSGMSRGGGKYAIFSASQILMLRSTFEIVMQEREQLVFEILDRLSRTNQVVEKCQRSPFHRGNGFTVMSLSITVLNAIECCLSRVSYPDNLKETICQLQREIYQPLGITPRVMVTVLQTSQPVLMTHLLRCHTCKETPEKIAAAAANNDDDVNCITCQCWDKFFTHVIQAFLETPNTATSPFSPSSAIIRR